MTGKKPRRTHGSKTTKKGKVRSDRDWKPRVTRLGNIRRVVSY